MQNKLNKRGLVWFLTLTFVPTIAVAVIARLINVSLYSGLDMRGQLILGGAMFFPLIAAIITQKFILKKDLKEMGFKLGPKKYYIQIFFLIIFFYFFLYGLTWLFVAAPDLALAQFIAQYNLELPLPAPQFIPLIFLVTLFIAPLINILPSLGEELGWRGFLLPALLPLGKKKALVISGIIWGLWHLPFVILIGFGYGEQNFWGTPLFLALITVLGVWFGYMRLISGSVWLPTFAHALFNAQAYGVWIMLWPSINPLIGGKVGIFALATYTVLAIILLKKTDSLKNNKPQTEDQTTPTHPRPAKL